MIIFIIFTFNNNNDRWNLEYHYKMSNYTRMSNMNI